MDSPSGRRPGSFHWAGTLWHELSHVYVLTATNHRVPRWFTEGMAVHEETAASPDWGDRLDPTVINAIRDKKLLPVAELDRGFIRPSYPNQVIVSYFQAGRICDFINEKWGYQTLLDMMHSFAKSKPTGEVVETHLKMKPEEFDKQFLAWLDTQVKDTVDKFPEFRKRFKELNAATIAKKYDDVIKLAPEVIAMYRDFVEHDSGYEQLATAYLAKDDKAAATKTLADYSKAGGRNPETLKKLAKLQEEAGKPADALKTLERLVYIYPIEEELHRRLGDLYFSQNRPEGAIREYTAVIATKPHDQAASHYNLARALQSAKRVDDAKEHLLLALEAAPGYKPAQKLLLELSR
ncbi:MAG TPA: tetratricopeptide repeat protein, partial [Bryobacteraceae bacterium]|nr:tetratricopeptide repeat protein [Bryobacteraceae bacterium]